MYLFIYDLTPLEMVSYCKGFFQSYWGIDTDKVVEKAFGNLKERLNMPRTQVPSEQSLDGKLFVEDAGYGSIQKPYFMKKI